uniref:Major histocompatibility complex class I-related gene protein-like n=1 Tax=Haplochromis burtoni TaxID=8153 RepID=A0A3Q2VV85_HAPBU
MNGCNWDDETGQINAFNQYSYNGEDFLTFDPQRLTWIALKPQAVITKLRWDGEEDQLKCNKNFYVHECPAFLKKYLYLFSVLPSVSLLQKSLSSPVSCHATGFYPNRGLMFWRKDGEELHEGVDPGEILPNNDGTFQMSIDLNVSSVTPEDWERYDCVFQLSGGEDIVTNLNESIIRTNWKGEKNIFELESFFLASFFIIIITLGITDGDPSWAGKYVHSSRLLMLDNHQPENSKHKNVTEIRDFWEDTVLCFVAHIKMVFSHVSFKYK